MKRSEINREIASAIDFFESKQFRLPKWAYWSPEDWLSNTRENSEIIENQLGWDLTDFGLGNYQKSGLLLFTIRNGKHGVDGKSYCEKIMIADENQVTPRHYHYDKMEDIINRGGGVLVVELYHSKPELSKIKAPIEVKIDGLLHKFEEGEKVCLEPGQSICLPSYMYHRFYGLEGKGKVLIGEVSAVNDDQNDNHFFDEIGRFPEIEEDEAISHLLISDYKKNGKEST